MDNNIKKNNKPRILIIIFIGIIAVYTGFIAFYIIRTEIRQQATNSSMRIADTNLDEINQGLLLLARDINQMRWAADLPVTDFPFMDNETAAELPGEDLTVSVFEAINTLSELKLKNEQLHKVAAFKNHGEFLELVKKHNLELQEAGDFKFKLVAGDQLYFLFEFLASRDIFSIIPFIGEKAQTAGVNQELSAYLVKNITAMNQHYQKLAARLEEFLFLNEDNTIGELLKKKGVSPSPLNENDDFFKIQILDKDRSLAVFLLNKRDLTLAAGERIYKNFSEYKTEVIRILESLNTKAWTVKNLATGLMQAFRQEGIYKLLDDLNLRVLPPKETTSAVSFPVVDLENQLAGTFVIRKKDFDGEITLVDNVGKVVGFLKNLPVLESP